MCASGGVEKRESGLVRSEELLGALYSGCLIIEQTRAIKDFRDCSS